MTPTYLSDVENILKDPVTGRWVIPQITFNTGIYPYGRTQFDIDPLNDDVSYHHKVADYFHTKLTEKWLYSAPAYRSLLKYFKVTKSGDKVTVELIADKDQAGKHKVEQSEEKFVFKFIEKYFATDKFVYKILKEYVKVTHIKWYDLYYNSSTLKDLMRHKLKRVIISTMYELNEK